MKQYIILSIFFLTFFYKANAQSNNRIYYKNHRTSVIPLTKPLNNKIVIQNDTIVFPRDGKSVFLVYKLFYNSSSLSQFRKGIVVMGSGNNEQNPTAGSLSGAAENALCNKSVQEGYVAAILQYTKGPGTADWNASAQQLAEDYDACISTLATKFNVSKTKSVAGGISYAGFMLLTANGYSNTLNYCKGILAPCSATSLDAASKFRVPVYNICCAGNNETGYGNENGQTLYNAIQQNVKSKSECIIDNGCQTHCGGNWTNQLYQKMQYWLQ